MNNADSHNDNDFIQCSYQEQNNTGEPKDDKMQIEMQSIKNMSFNQKQISSFTIISHDEIEDREYKISQKIGKYTYIPNKPPLG